MEKGDTMKKTEQIGVRLSPELKEKLQKIADEKHWTLSQTVNLILEAYCKDERRIDIL